MICDDETEIRERELHRLPPSPCRVWRPDPDTGELRLVDEDWEPKPPKQGKARYRDSMLRGSGWVYGGE